MPKLRHNKKYNNNKQQTKGKNDKNKIAFNDIESGTMQDITRKFIDNHIIYNQSYLVSELMSKEVISIEDYINFYKSDEIIKYDFSVSTDEEIQEIRDNGEDQQEVYEHWLCSDWFINQMKKQDEPILETDLGTWWGRTCTGQAIYLDYDVQELAYQYSHDERLYKKRLLNGNNYNCISYSLDYGSSLMIKQIIIVSIMITFILFLGYLGIEYLIAQLINDIFAIMENKNV